MTRQALIDRLTPSERYSPTYPAPLFPMCGEFLFAATDENAGYFLLTDGDGRVLPFTEDAYLAVVSEARLKGVKLRNMRVFGAKGALKRAPGVRFYPIDQLAVA